MEDTDYDRLISTANPQQNSIFFKPPLEVRNMIFKHVLISRGSHEIIIRLKGCWPDSIALYICHPNYTALLCVCRQLYVEAMPFLYGNARFQFERAVHVSGFVRSIGSVPRSSLRSLILGHRVCGNVSSIRDMYKELSNCANLKQLDFRVCGDDYKLYLKNKDNPAKWHPSCAIQGLQNVKIFDFPHIERELNWMRISREDFEDFKMKLAAFLVSKKKD